MAFSSPNADQSKAQQDRTVAMEDNLSLVWISLDWTTHEATLLRSDGAIGTVNLSFGDLDPHRIHKTAWNPQGHILRIGTTEGDWVELELSRFEQIDQLENRVVVYLDQCIWRRMTDAMHNRAALEPQELAAADELIGLVEQRKIVLPLSSGHHVETTQWGDHGRRYQLGLTTLRLSRGWAARDPITVRRQEFRKALLGSVQAHADEPPPVFTLEPNVASSGLDPATAPPDFPPDVAYVFQNVTYTTAIASTLLDAEQIPRTKGGLDWVDTNEKFGRWLDGEAKRTGPQKRKSVDALYFADVGQHIAEEAHAAGLTAEQMSRWTRGSMFTDMEEMPSVGLYREVLQGKHLNVGTSWSANDLTDMIYLSEAAGYADVVVAERHMTAMLTQAQQRLSRQQTVYSSLTKALPAIRRELEARAAR